MSRGAAVKNHNKNKVVCGVAVVVTRGDKVLFGQRKNDDGSLCWQLPGGWLEPGETPEQAARREVREETGLELERLDFVALTNNRFSPEMHSISLYFEAKCAQTGAVTLAETDRCANWVWKPWSEVQEDCFLPLRLLKTTDYQPFSRDNGQTYVSF